MLSTNQSKHIEQPSQGVLVSKHESKHESKSESKAESDLPEKSSFSKLFSSMKLATASEVSVSTASAANTSAVSRENSVELMVLPQVSESEDVTLSVMQQLPTLGVASDHANSNLLAGLSLPDSQSSDAPLSTMQPLPASEITSNKVGSNLLAELSLPDSKSSESAPLSIIQPLPISEIATNKVGRNLTAELSLPDPNGGNLTALGVADIEGEVEGDANSNLLADLSLSDSDAPLVVVEEIADPLLIPVIDGSEVKADSERLIASPVVSHNAAENSELVGDTVVQNIALNQSSVGRENSATVQLNGAVSNAASNSVTSWGTQAHTAGGSVSGGDVQSGAAQSQTFTQGGQGGQNSQSQAGQQQAMMFAQFVKEGKAQAFEQQAAVRAIDESTLKSEVKELLGAEMASTDRRGQLPLGLQTIQQPLKHPQWGQALGQRVVFMANNSIQQAQITLNPEKLGQIQVTLQLDKDQRMNVSLTAQNGMTRESMESALPKLREMFEQAGITLGSMNVSDQKQFSGNADDKTTSSGMASNSAVEEEGAIIESALSTVKTTDNIVDYYA